jgi:hypothetical protein
MTTAIRTERLGKRYGSTWALRDCTLEIPAGSVTALALSHAWVISEHPSDLNGHSIVARIGACPGGNLKACFLSHAPGMHAVYEPASRFWSMQLVEFGLFAGVAVALIAFSAWWADRHA